MKGLKGILAAAALLAVCACRDYLGGGQPWRGRGKQFNPFEEDTVQAGDTVVLVSAVEILDRGYDWRKDSLGVGFGARIVLFENGVRVREIETGEANSVSPDFDMHHIVGGDIYTEYSDGRFTVFKCNDTVISRFEGRERLMGVVRARDGFHILSQGRGSDGIRLRHDGEVVFTNSNAGVFGSFSDTSYPRSGALYLDDGACCFAYRCEVAGKESFYVCVNGNSRLLALPCEGKVEDIKMVGGRPRMWISDKLTGRYCDESGNRPVSVKGRRCANGRILKDCRGADAYVEVLNVRAGKGGSAIWSADGGIDSYPCTEAFLAMGDGYPDVVSREGGGLTVYHGGSQVTRIADSCYFMSRSCACRFGRSVYLAVTPSDLSEKPYLWASGDTAQFNVYGFLTGVNVIVSPSSKVRGSRFREHEPSP